MPKSNGSLLARIDERTAYIQRDIKELKTKHFTCQQNVLDKFDKVFTILSKHNVRIALIEKNSISYKFIKPVMDIIKLLK